MLPSSRFINVSSFFNSLFSLQLSRISLAVYRVQKLNENRTETNKAFSFPCSFLLFFVFHFLRLFISCFVSIFHYFLSFHSSDTSFPSFIHSFHLPTSSSSLPEPFSSVGLNPEIHLREILRGNRFICVVARTLRNSISQT
jgi:hypothetical protein